MALPVAERIKALPPYLFADLDRQKAEVAAKGIDVISLGIGDPNLDTPEHIIQALEKAARVSEHQKYPAYDGSARYKEAAATFMKNRFNVKIEDPQRDVLALIGSKEGIGHTPLAFCDPGSVVLYTSPGYPVYPVAASFVGARPVPVGLFAKNDFLPDLESIDDKTWDDASIFFLNYPNNPTAAIAPDSFFNALIEKAKRHNVLICHDMAYSEIYYGEPPKSILEFDGASDIAIEFHSLSKTYNMTGWRVGFVTGNSEAIQTLGKVKTNLDSGVFGAVQEAGIAALTGPQDCVEEFRKDYARRRDVVCDALQAVGIDVTPPPATFYVWFPVPEGTNSKDFCSNVLQKTGVVLTPGVGFGDEGEGFARISLTVNEARLNEAMQRIREAGQL
jgi:LL-diaminopimelate aminotransferase